jgi:hypothetical protein
MSQLYGTKRGTRDHQSLLHCTTCNSKSNKEAFDDAECHNGNECGPGGDNQPEVLATRAPPAISGDSKELLVDAE